MFSIVHILLPMSDVAPAEAIRASLAPFERGGKGDFPAAWLTFHDETDHLKALHEAEFVFTREDGGGLRVEGGDTTYLDMRPCRREWPSGMSAVGRSGCPTSNRTWRGLPSVSFGTSKGTP